MALRDYHYCYKPESYDLAFDCPNESLGKQDNCQGGFLRTMECVYSYRGILMPACDIFPYGNFKK